MVPVMVFLIFPRFWEIVYIQCSIYFNSNFICLISVIFLRDVTPYVKEIENEGKDFDRESKRPRGTTSKVLDHFTKIGVKDGKERAKCKACGAKYVTGGTKIGTSTMLGHLSKSVVLKKLKDNDVGKMIIDHAGKLRFREIDQKVVDDLISMAIIQHGLPYNFVEYKWIKELLVYLNPEVRVPSRNTAVFNTSKKFHEHNERVKLAMRKSRSRIYSTSDCWISINQEGFICLTAHFVDASWKLSSKIIAFCKMEPPHTGCRNRNRDGTANQKRK